MSKRRLILGILIVGLVVPFALKSDNVNAFPGSNRDEDCQKLIEQAVMSIDAGQAVENPDCITDPGLSAMDMRAAYATMQQYPAPDFPHIAFDESLLTARKYRRLVGDVQIFSSPNPDAPVVETLPPGYHHVTIGAILDGWVQVGTDRWVKSENVQQEDVSQLTGVLIDHPLERPFAWMIAPESPSSYPGGPPNEALPKIERYTLMNIFGVEVVNGFEWYLIGPNQWIQQLRVAKVKPVQRPTDVGLNDQWVAVDLFEQTAVAYQGDDMVFATLVATGLPNWSTQEGLFKIYQRWNTAPMTGAAGQAEYYLIQNVPWVMYFNNDMALHGAYWHDKFGYRQSRGCVNLSILDAHWIYEWTQATPDGAAWVYVYSSGEYRSDLPGWAVRAPRK
ncbi:MAG: L,D-transpeptidase [Chloroflexi bacterium]|nr:L,D-transpeptidase [Chloroflexota bacterium]